MIKKVWRTNSEPEFSTTTVDMDGVENFSPGYFCTVEELRECFEAGMATEANPHDYPDFKQWLASKEVKGE